MPTSLIDATVFAWIGWAVTTAILAFLYFLTGYLGVQVFKRMRRIYSLEVIGYWLRRFEAKGHATFKSQVDPDE